jgi:hypothetical protein
MTKRRRIVWLFLLALGLVAAPHLGWTEIKLVLKDGSFQVVKTYEVRGERVRYYSVERSEWEEMPKSLVDFAATERAQEEEKAAEQQQLDEVKELEKQRFEKPEETGYVVAPGVRLPGEPGVFAFDGARVVRMIESPAEVVRDKKRLAMALALPAPLLKNRALVVLAGAKAAVRIVVDHPSFFVQGIGGSGTQVELIPLKPGKEARVVEKIQSGIGVGPSGELRDSLPLERVEVAPGLIRLRPTQALALGEYVLGEVTQDKLNLNVWDFGVDGAVER